MRSRGNEFLPKAKTRRASVSVVQFIDFAPEGWDKREASWKTCLFFVSLRSRGNEFLPKAKTRRASASVVQFIDFASEGWGKREASWKTCLFFCLYAKSGKWIFAEGKNPQGKRKRSSIHRLRQRVEIKKLERKFGLFSFSICEVGGKNFCRRQKPEGQALA